MIIRLCDVPRDEQHLLGISGLGDVVRHDRSRLRKLRRNRCRRGLRATVPETRPTECCTPVCGRPCV